ncbi:hypothetical protein BCY89_05445 [Sphingobacterium siyangense]|uniref:Uncharacterized protein n=1 Tax=Sphingobacterium siyangense TaxID=459529 RepID=A0A420FVU6_9SPHI|nr:hypothetical protein BCY89_05445 [Sphingobacterium siyangense]
MNLFVGLINLKLSQLALAVHTFSMYQYTSHLAPMHIAPIIKKNNEKKSISLGISLVLPCTI